MVESQSPPEPRPLDTQELGDPKDWTDAQQPDSPRLSPVEGSMEGEPEKGLKEGPSDTPEGAGGQPAPPPHADSDLGESASVVPPQPETNKRDPIYWKFLGNDRPYMCHVPSP